ncbi:MAG: hypothetical protein AB1716_10715 [Planctomycetota bacterium]
MIVAIWLLSTRWVFGYQQQGDGFWIGYGGVTFGHVSTEKDPEYATPGWFLKPCTGPIEWEPAGGGIFGAGIWEFFPLLPCIASVAAPGVVLWIAAWWLRRHRYGAGRCHRCGHDLTGNVSGRCAECGAAVHVPSRAERT